MVRSRERLGELLRFYHREVLALFERLRINRDAARGRL